jgi:glycosyltransferase involved in cell wall biosynthesis
VRISVAVITYNWPEALELVLEALARQSLLPYEVIVTDDGSRPDTRALIERIAPDYPTRLVHLWQEDDGARMSRARNRAIAAAQGEYVILLDGDMVTERHFVADHQTFARISCFAQGSRVLTNEACTRSMFDRRAVDLGFFTRGIQRRRHTIRFPPLAHWYAKPSIRRRGIKSCNMAFWRDDLIKLNGFNEAMTGWGREDTELATRAFHAGLLRRDVRFSALGFHLHHRSRKNVADNPNDAILSATRAQHLVRCQDGLDRHLDEFTIPPPDVREMLGIEPPRLVAEARVSGQA